jgi:hypothetical protein
VIYANDDPVNESDPSGLCECGNNLAQEVSSFSSNASLVLGIALAFLACPFTAGISCGFAAGLSIAATGFATVNATSSCFFNGGNCTSAVVSLAVSAAATGASGAAVRSLSSASELSVAKTYAPDVVQQMTNAAKSAEYAGGLGVASNTVSTGVGAGLPTGC